MNWLQRIKNITLTITTGDGEEFTPLWRNASKEVQYNTEVFDFIGIDGSYVERDRRSGRRFPFTFIFQGENNIKQAERFEKSANDPRPWQIKHPYYDTILVQPIELTFNNDNHNVTRVTGTLWETNDEKYPQKIPSKENTIKNNKVEVDENAAESIENEITDPDTSLIQSARDSVNAANEAIKKYISTVNQYQNFENQVNRALSDSNNIISQTYQALSATQQLINNIVDNDLIKISDKIDAFRTLFNNLKNRLTGEDATFEDVKLFELQGVTICTAASVSSILADYSNRGEVLQIMDRIENIYNDYSRTFDEIQQNQNGTIALQVDSLVNETLANLYLIAYNAKQTRRFITEKDTNIIVLAHRFYGPGDESLQEFIRQNSIGLFEHLQVKKGREIIYFV